MMFFSSSGLFVGFVWLLILRAAPIHALASRPQQHKQGLLAFDVWRPTFAIRQFHKDENGKSPRKFQTLLYQQKEEEQQHSQQQPDLVGEENKEQDKKLIQIRSEIELPFSAEVAYEAYSDLPRQPSWSSWLESVVVLNNEKDKNNRNSRVESKWTSKVMGIRYSWTAEAVQNVRPHTIQWRSVTGLRNEGIVRFYPMDAGAGYDQGPTKMTLQMAFVVPRAVTSIVKRSKRLSKFVEESMIAQSLKDFRDKVIEEDLAQSKTTTKTTKSSTVL